MGHRKQVLLFLIAVVLPSAVLVMLAWRMIDQQRELDEKRQAEERTSVANSIRQKLLARLERIKLQEVIDNENVFIAEVEIPNDKQLLRPGMEGRARISADRHPLGWNLFHKAWYAALAWLGW